MVVFVYGILWLCRIYAEFMYIGWFFLYCSVEIVQFLYFRII